VYYTVATVHAVATSKSIRLCVDIPLKDADRYFELYQVHSLPFFHNFMVLWFRFTSKHYPCMWKFTLTPKRSPMTNTTQQLNTNAAELQITRGEEEGETTDVEREHPTRKPREAKYYLPYSFGPGRR
jgi:hypothetical protein